MHQGEKNTVSKILISTLEWSDPSTESKSITRRNLSHPLKDLNWRYLYSNVFILFPPMDWIASHRRRHLCRIQWKYIIGSSAEMPSDWYSKCGSPKHARRCFRPESSLWKVQERWEAGGDARCLGLLTIHSYPSLSGSIPQRRRSTDSPTWDLASSDIFPASFDQKDKQVQGVFLLLIPCKTTVCQGYAASRQPGSFSGPLRAQRG